MAAGWCTGCNSTSLGLCQLVQIRVNREQENCVVQISIAIPSLVSAACPYCARQPLYPTQQSTLGLTAKTELLASEGSYQLQGKEFIMLWYTISSCKNVATKGCWTVFGNFVFRQFPAEREFWCFWSLLALQLHLWDPGVILRSQCKCQQIIGVFLGHYILVCKNEPKKPSFWIKKFLWHLPNIALSWFSHEVVIRQVPFPNLSLSFEQLLVWTWRSRCLCFQLNLWKSLYPKRKVECETKQQKRQEVREMAEARGRRWSLSNKEGQRWQHLSFHPPGINRISKHLDRVFSCLSEVCLL